MVFDSLAGEPDVTELRRWAADRHVDVFVPLVDGRDLRVMPGDLDPAELDAVIVPGLAFTRDGHRLGQGGGHFDRFLPRVAPGCLRIGVAFHEQLVDEVPLEPHDVTLDVVVTDHLAAGQAAPVARAAPMAPRA
jgi:5-formyltetrahydrofolate cyclo-ligase